VPRCHRYCRQQRRHCRYQWPPKIAGRRLFSWFFKRARARSETACISCVERNACAGSARRTCKLSRNYKRATSLLQANLATRVVRWEMGENTCAEELVNQAFSVSIGIDCRKSYAKRVTKIAVAEPSRSVTTPTSLRVHAWRGGRSMHDNEGSSADGARDPSLCSCGY
jgi:hypothetical protein